LFSQRLNSNLKYKLYFHKLSSYCSWKNAKAKIYWSPEGYSFAGLFSFEPFDAKDEEILQTIYSISVDGRFLLSKDVEA
jgi:hypothetical protein